MGVKIFLDITHIFGKIDDKVTEQSVIQCAEARAASRDQRTRDPGIRRRLSWSPTRIEIHIITTKIFYFERVSPPVGHCGGWVSSRGLEAGEGQVSARHHGVLRAGGLRVHCYCDTARGPRPRSRGRGARSSSLHLIYLESRYIYADVCAAQSSDLDWWHRHRGYRGENMTTRPPDTTSRLSRYLAWEWTMKSYQLQIE